MQNNNPFKLSFKTDCMTRSLEGVTLERDLGDMSQRQHCAGCATYVIPNTFVDLEEEIIYICPNCVQDDKIMTKLSRQYGFEKSSEKQEGTKK